LAQTAGALDDVANMFVSAISSAAIRWAEMDAFDRVQLAHVVEVCRQCRSLSEAGRLLFSASRGRKASTNDAESLAQVPEPISNRVVADFVCGQNVVVGAGRLELPFSI
jgi:hypothetical protein